MLFYSGSCLKNFTINHVLALLSVFISVPELLCRNGDFFLPSRGLTSLSNIPSPLALKGKFHSETEMHGRGKATGGVQLGASQGQISRLSI